jgi:hypothetical protein
MKRYAPLRRKTRLRSESPKRRAQRQDYTKLRRQYLADNPICEVWLRENGWQKIARHIYEKQTGHFTFTRGPNGLTEENKAPAATEIHHMNKRHGTRLCDTTHFLAVCRANHDRIENNKAWARREGFLLNF